MKCKYTVQFPVSVKQLYTGAGTSTHIIGDLVMLFDIAGCLLLLTVYFLIDCIVSLLVFIGLSTLAARRFL